MADRTHYGVLGLADGASPAEVRRAYRELVRILHPDRHSTGPLQETETLRLAMAEINDAWAVLSHPQRRRAYDASLGLAPTPPSEEPAALPVATAGRSSRRTERWREALATPSPRRTLALLAAAAVLGATAVAGTTLRTSTVPVSRVLPAGTTTTSGPPAPVASTTTSIPTTSTTTTTTVSPPVTAGPQSSSSWAPGFAPVQPLVEVHCSDGGVTLVVVPPAGPLAGATLQIRNDAPEAAIVDPGTAELRVNGVTVTLAAFPVLAIDPGQVTPLDGALPPLLPAAAVEIVRQPLWAAADGGPGCR